MRTSFRSPQHAYIFAAYLITLFTITIAGCADSTSVKQPSLTPTDTQIPPNTHADLPDLIISDISIELNTEDICAADTKRVLARMAVSNVGSADAEPFVTEMNNAWQEAESGLAAGEEITFWFPGAESATIIVDATDKIIEIDEKNNQLNTYLEIPSPAPACFQTPTPAATIIEPSSTLEGHTADVLSVDFSPDGNLVGSSSVDNTLRLWRVNEAELLRTMRGHPFPVTTIKFSPDGTLLVTGSTDGLVRIWNVSDGKLLRILKGHAGRVKRIDITRDGKYIVSCADDFTVRLWRTYDGSLLQTIDEGMAMISDVAFSPDGQSIAWAELNGYIRVRSLDGAWLYIYKDSESPAASVAFSPDGDLLASGYADGNIHIYDLRYGELHQTHTGHKDKIESLSFSPDNKWMASASSDHTIRLWRINKYGYPTYPVYILVGHLGPTNSVSFSPKRAIIASGSDDHTVRFWEIPNP